MLRMVNEDVLAAEGRFISLEQFKGHIFLPE